MTEARARQLREVLSNAMQLVSDEIALENPMMYPEWEEGKTFTNEDIGFKFRYNGVLYKVLQGHTTNVAYPPGTTVSLYAEVLAGQEGTEIGEWVQPDSTNPYMFGNRVYHNNKLWESDMDYNVFEPGVAGWHEVVE